MTKLILFILLGATASPSVQAGDVKDSRQDVMDFCNQFVIRDPDPGPLPPDRGGIVIAGKVGHFGLAHPEMPMAPRRLPLIATHFHPSEAGPI
jgi:hypothetical protein